LNVFGDYWWGQLHFVHPTNCGLDYPAHPIYSAFTTLDRVYSCRTQGISALVSKYQKH